MKQWTTGATLRERICVVGKNITPRTIYGKGSALTLIYTPTLSTIPAGSHFPERQNRSLYSHGNGQQSLRGQTFFIPHLSQEPYLGKLLVLSVSHIYVWNRCQRLGGISEIKINNNRRYVEEF